MTVVKHSEKNVFFLVNVFYRGNKYAALPYKHDTRIHYLRNYYYHCQKQLRLNAI